MMPRTQGHEPAASRVCHALHAEARDELGRANTEHESVLHDFIEGHDQCMHHCPVTGTIILAWVYRKRYLGRTYESRLACHLLRRAEGAASLPLGEGVGSGRTTRSLYAGILTVSS